MDFELEIVNWEKYNPRRDIKHPWWFAFSNRLFDDPDFSDFSAEEIAFWIYILCQASLKNSKFVRLKFGHYKNKFSSKVAKSAISKLISCTESVRICTQSVPTEQNRTEQDKTIQERVCDSDESLPPLMILWNKNIGKDLSKVKKSNAQRNKLCRTRFANHSSDEWISIIKKISASDFCCGKSDRGWKATFDWLLKPDTALRVLEGKYDNGPGVGSDKWAKFYERWKDEDVKHD